MAVMGFDSVDWWRDPRLAASIENTAPVSRVALDFDGGRLTVRCTTKRDDRHSAAWAVTEALTPLWSAIVDPSVGLRVIVDALQVDVSPRFFADGVHTRQRWAALSSSMLANVQPL